MILTGENCRKENLSQCHLVDYNSTGRVEKGSKCYENLAFAVTSRYNYGEAGERVSLKEPDGECY
jgi:hypothetical protein